VLLQASIILGRRAVALDPLALYACSMVLTISILACVCHARERYLWLDARCRKVWL
jgi:hypothetical protein